MNKNVEHPDHYNWLPGVECLSVVQWFNFNVGNAIKYLWRYGRKDPEKAIEDLEKARMYIDLEIDRIKNHGL